MWLFCESGFFSIVSSRTDRRDLVVRTRFKEDLDNLREKYLPSLGRALSHRGSDYQYRAIVRKDEFAKALDAMAQDIVYQNFKQAVGMRPTEKSGRVFGDLDYTSRASLKPNRRRRVTTAHNADNHQSTGMAQPATP